MNVHVDILLFKCIFELFDHLYVNVVWCVWPSLGDVPQTAVTPSVIILQDCSFFSLIQTQKRSGFFSSCESVYLLLLSVSRAQSVCIDVYSNWNFLICGVGAHELSSVLTKSFLLCVSVRSSFCFLPKPDNMSLSERTPCDVMIGLHPDSRDGSSQTVYKTEPGTETCFSLESHFNTFWM